MITEWVRGLMREPSQVIGPADNPYLLRWILFRHKSLPRVYLHRFVRSDDDRALHDHPWWFISILLRGSYREHRPDGVHVRHAPSVAFRPITTLHRVELARQPVWTLVITGPRVRGWGFWCEDEFVPWREFNGCQE